MTATDACGLKSWSTLTAENPNSLRLAYHTRITTLAIAGFATEKPCVDRE